MRTLSALVAVLAVPALALAHEGHDHGAHKMMGTVTAVHADMNHVEMKDSKTGKTTGFYVDSNTKIVRGAATVALADLKAGTKVVVSGKMAGDKMMASEVKVGAAGKVAASDGHTTHKH